MSITLKKVVFFIVWLLLLLIGPYTVFKDANLSLILKSQPLLINFLQRIIGLMAFTLLFIQIILGSNMQKLTQKLGGWIYSFHIFEGVLIYLLVFSHPLLFTIFNYKINGSLDPFYVYTQICVICKNNLEVFYTLGRVSFWLLTITVSAAWFRTNPILRIHWKKFHILNYLVFFLVWLHSYELGTDINSSPFYYFHRLSVFIILLIVVSRAWSLYQTSRGMEN